MTIKKISVSPPIGFEKCIKKKIDIHLETDKLYDLKEIPGWKGFFINGSGENAVVDYEEARNIIYMNQHIFGRSSADEFFALACWGNFGKKKIYTLYKGVTFPTLNFDDPNQARSKAKSADFLITWHTDVSFNWNRKKLEVYLEPFVIHFDPTKLLLESQNYSNRTSSRDLSEAIRSILR